MKELSVRISRWKSEWLREWMNEWKSEWVEDWFGKFKREQWKSKDVNVVIIENMTEWAQGRIREQWK